MILDLSVVSNASRTLKDGGGTGIRLGPNVTSIAGPFCELGPSVNTHLFYRILHDPQLPILSGSHLGSRITVWLFFKTD